MSRVQLAVITTGFLLLALAGFVPGRALAQPVQDAGPGEAVVVAPSPPRAFGTVDEVSYTIHATDFDAAGSSQDWGVSLSIPWPTGGYTKEALGPGTGFFGASVRLPAGAQVSRLEVSACDGSATAKLSFSLVRIHEPSGAGTEQVTPEGTTGAGQTPGCGLFGVDVDPAFAPLIIDNIQNTYIVFLRSEPGTNFSAARVFYRLRVSPAPATATFGDVPASHPFFQFVEALVASGITAGCGGGNYCPDAPLTRGQMAVFLSKGLGLHFAP